MHVMGWCAHPPSWQLSAAVDKLAMSLKPPPVQIMSLISGYQTTQAMGAFARLRVADAMAKLTPADGGLVEVEAIAKEARALT
jgi:hypothetical protein